jgi:hypothetical protein
MSTTFSRMRIADVVGRGPNLKTLCQYAARWVRLGERVGLAPDWAGLHQGPCDYQPAIREPRPNGGATSHLSLLTSYFSHPGYVCF